MCVRGDFLRSDTAGFSDAALLPSRPPYRSAVVSLPVNTPEACPRFFGLAALALTQQGSGYVAANGYVINQPFKASSPEVIEPII